MLVLSLAGRGGAARYEGMVVGMAQTLGQRGEFVGAALPRRRWLVLSLAGRGGAARYEGMVVGMVQKLGQRCGVVGAALPQRRWLVLSLAGRGGAARYEGMVVGVVQKAWFSGRYKRSAKPPGIVHPEGDDETCAGGITCRCWSWQTRRG